MVFTPHITFFRLPKTLHFTLDFNRETGKRSGNDRLRLYGNSDSVAMLRIAKNLVNLKNQRVTNFSYLMFFRHNLMYNQFFKFQCHGNHSETHLTIRDRNPQHFSPTLSEVQALNEFPARCFIIVALSSAFEGFVPPTNLWHGRNIQFSCNKPVFQFLRQTSFLVTFEASQ